MADTIIYDVIIRNPNPQDTWATECLKNINRKTLIDSLFNIAYSGEAKVLDFFSGEELKEADIRRFEEKADFNREKIGKIQFTECWLYDTKDNTLYKEVISVVLGYELFNEEGEIRGYRPIFKLFFR